MYPELLDIGGFTVTAFGAMVAVAGLVGVWLYGNDLRAAGLPREGADIAALGVICGLFGAKALYVLEHVGEAPLASLLTERAGLSWFGGLALGVVVTVWLFRRQGLPVITMIATATPALAAGHALGRVGCFLVGDDYGRPTSLPWGVAFPHGLPPTDVPVHPTQIYEAAALAMYFVLLRWWLRDGVAAHAVLGRYLLLTGLTRFAIEFIRVNERVLGPLTLAHLVAAALATVGVALLARSAPGASRTAAGR